MGVALSVAQAQRIIAQRSKARTFEQQSIVASAVAALTALGYVPPDYIRKGEPVRHTSGSSAVTISPSPPLRNTAAQTLRAPQLSAVNTSSNAMPTNWGGVLSSVGSLVGSVFGGTGATSTAPTTSGSTSLTTSDIAGAVGTVAGSVIGAPALGNTVGRLGSMALPGRASAPVSHMSDVVLEAGGNTAARRPRGWSKLRIRALVRMVGPGAASNILDMPLEEVAKIAISPGRRARGISARDLRVTRRVTRRVLSIARDLSQLKPSAPRRRAIGTRVVCN